MGKAEDKLAEIIDEKDYKIDDLESKIEDLEYKLDAEKWAWQRHSHFLNSDFYKGIPYPRLEMKFSRVGSNWHSVIWDYGVVYANFADASGRSDDENIMLSFIPLGRTNGSGGDGTFEKWVRDGKLDTPYRDGVHIHADSEVFNLPAYISCEEKGIIQKLEFENKISENMMDKLKFIE